MPNDVRNFILDKGYDCAAAVTKFMAVKMTGDQTVGPVTAISDIVIGMTQESVSAGDITKGKGAPVAVQGISAFVAGATPCVAGNKLALGVLANGTLVPLGYWRCRYGYYRHLHVGCRRWWTWFRPPDDVVKEVNE